MLNTKSCFKRNQAQDLIFLSALKTGFGACGKTVYKYLQMDKKTKRHLGSADCSDRLACSSDVVRDCPVEGSGEPRVLSA